MKKVLTALCVALLAFSLTACGTTDTDESVSDSSQTESLSIATAEQVIYEDDYLKATYKGVSETSGVIVMTVALENKSDEEITVLPMDSSVDGTMVQFTSGTLATIQAGKTFNQGWILSSMPTEEIEFSMSICDSDMSEILQTDVLTIEME